MLHRVGGELKSQRATSLYGNLANMLGGGTTGYNHRLFGFQMKMYSLPSLGQVTLGRAVVSDANMSNMHNTEQKIHQGGF